MSAENLCMNGKPVKNEAYVVVHTQSRTKFFTTRTQTKEEGGSKSNNNNPSWNGKFMPTTASRWRKGRRNGVINFSVRVLKESAESESLVESQNNLRGFGMQLSMGGDDDSSGIVTGIPVFWNYPLNIPRCMSICNLEKENLD
ncbi:hypothetical protein JHK87_026218 [Glycine soja]|nr:hypothetical protein JHK87_026218 [Glycine soja]KAG5014140.1 hypothetical protein JHK86_026401 [Glycine max]